MKHFIYSPLCDNYAQEIDRLTDTKDYETLASYIGDIEKEYANNNTIEFAPLFYILGTGNITLADNYSGIESSNAQALSYRKKALFYFRKAIQLLENNTDNHYILLPIYTNYANALDSCGRVIEALRIYRKAIQINNSFGMAIANYGRALSFYANIVNDPGHRFDLHCHAYQSIKNAIKSKHSSLHKEAINVFQKQIDAYESSYDQELLSSSIIYPDYDLGAHEEREYRLWCLDHHLFLNPLNDLIEIETAFAHDPVIITRYTECTQRDKSLASDNISPPKWFAMLNQLKEEFIYARFLCYEGCEKTTVTHYADKQVLLTFANYDRVNDCVYYSIRLEQLKSSFRISYSLIDQIAFMINEFWTLGFKERQADAHHVFGCKDYPTNNVALTALYWSFNEFKEEFVEGADPSEEELKTLRNALEHKFLQVHEYLPLNDLHIMNDRFYHVSESKLKEYVLRILALAREWILELVYAIAIEEDTQKQANDTVRFHIPDYDDQWKL